MDPGLDALDSHRVRIRKRCHVLKPQLYKNHSFAFRSSQKVWVGGLSSEVTWQTLQQLADTAGKSKWIQILGNGQACICYGTAEDAQTAIATLNGSAALHFDVWTKNEKA